MKNLEDIAHDPDDLVAVSLWMNCEPKDLEIRLSFLPASVFEKQVQEMLASYAQFPDEEIRTRRILQMLRMGDPARPVYVEAGDEAMFIMEGRHRIVAFHLMGLADIPVATTSVRPSEKLRPETGRR